jgi:hypothetical protein
MMTSPPRGVALAVSLVNMKFYDLKRRKNSKAGSNALVTAVLMQL